MVALNLSRAFDTVCHNYLLKDILESTRQKLAIKLYQRVTVLSRRSIATNPLQFLHVQPDIRRRHHPIGHKHICRNIVHTHQCVCYHINYLAKNMDLELSLSKSTATLFTTRTHAVSTIPYINLNNQQLPIVNKPKILGVVFDNKRRP